MTATLITAYDELDEAIGERGRSDVTAAFGVKRALENLILSSRADTQEVLAWKVRHLSRALRNEWDEEYVTPITDSIERDLRIGSLNAVAHPSASRTSGCHERL